MSIQDLVLLTRHYFKHKRPPNSVLMLISGGTKSDTTMRRLVLALILVNLALATAASQQQNDLSLDGLIDKVFPSTTTPQSVPQIGSDIDKIFSNVTTTSTPRTTQNKINQRNSTTTDCECVPYYQCNPDKIVEENETIRYIFRRQVQGDGGQCEDYFYVCCKRSHIETKNKPPSTARIGCGVRHPDGVGLRMTGLSDNEAQFGEFPWMVAILNEEFIGPEGQKLNVYLCGGALIHRRAVLTAAHCVKKKLPQDLKIRAGEWDAMTKNEIFPHQDRNVEKVVVHENFHSGTLYNDFALLILKEPVDYANNVDIVCLPEMNAVFDGSKCFACGWGKDMSGKEGRYHAILKRVELPVVPRERCQDTLRTTKLGENFVLDKSLICAGGETGKDTCKGDGGSPLVCPLASDPKRYVQAGIVAWGLGCGEDGIPGVYSNVADSRRWIDEQMAFYNLDNTVYQYPS